MGEDSKRGSACNWVDKGSIFWQIKNERSVFG